MFLRAQGPSFLKECEMNDDMPIRAAIVRTLGAKDISKIPLLAQTYDMVEIRTVGDLRNATPQTLRKLSQGPLNGAAVELSTLMLAHDRVTLHQKEKPPPRRR
jgi:hypothetical protein